MLLKIVFLIAPRRESLNPVIQPEKILIIEYWNLGDLVILIPFLRNLRQAFPKAHIELLVKDGLASFLAGQGLVDDFVSVRIPWAQHFSRWKKYNPFSGNWISSARILLHLRKRKFDWAFSGRMDIRDNLLMWLVGAQRRIGYGIGGGRFLLTDEVVPDYTHPHRAHLWLGLLRHMGVEVQTQKPEFRLTNAERDFASEFLAQNQILKGDFVVGVHPGARNPTRRWPQENFVSVATRIQSEFNAKILWFSDPAETKEADRLKCFVPVKLPFRRFLGVLARCQILLCNDSGPMHLASALAVPVVAVFGPTEPAWFGPLGRSELVIHPDFPCRPCFDYCIYDHPHCLDEITVGEVLETTRAEVIRMQHVNSDSEIGLSS